MFLTQRFINGNLRQNIHQKVLGCGIKSIFSRKLIGGHRVYRERSSVNRFRSICSSTPRLRPESQTKTLYNSNTTTSASKTQVLENGTELRWKEPEKFTLSVYTDLSKAKLSALVVLTSMVGYAMAPGSLSVVQLLWTTSGTALCVCSANTINQWIESAYDAQMARTRTRVIVKRTISPPHAFFAGTFFGITGVGLLYTMVNPLCAMLGAANIIIYTLMYTPLKRISVANTWAGAVVGGIPPVMGWVAVTNSIDPGAIILGLALYAWQFPHFNALSWNLRPDYSKAGYRMMSVVNPNLNSRVALRYSLFLFPICWASSYIDVTSTMFLFNSTFLNACMLYPAAQFWRDSNERTARKLFFASLIHLPVLLALFMIHKSV